MYLILVHGSLAMWCNFLHTVKRENAFSKSSEATETNPKRIKHDKKPKSDVVVLIDLSFCTHFSAKTTNPQKKMIGDMWSLARLIQILPDSDHLKYGIRSATVSQEREIHYLYFGFKICSILEPMSSYYIVKSELLVRPSYHIYIMCMAI